MVDPKKFWASKAEKLKRENKFEDAVKVLDKVNKIKKDEKSKDYWYKKGINHFEIREYDNAKDAIERNLEQGTRKYDSYLLMGKIFYKLNRFEESLEYYNKAYEEYSKEHLRNSSKIDQMKNVRKFEEAVKYADKLYQKKELDQEFWFNKGMTLINLRKFEDASICFKNGLETDQNNVEILYELAKSELFSGNRQSLFFVLEKLCGVNSDIREKLRSDRDFEPVFQEKQFQEITGLSP